MNIINLPVSRMLLTASHLPESLESREVFLLIIMSVSTAVIMGKSHFGKPFRAT